jgi:hypothetical protein
LVSRLVIIAGATGSAQHLCYYGVHCFLSTLSCLERLY